MLLRHIYLVLIGKTKQNEWFLFFSFSFKCGPPILILFLSSLLPCKLYLVCLSVPRLVYLYATVRISVRACVCVHGYVCVKGWQQPDPLILKRAVVQTSPGLVLFESTGLLHPSLPPSTSSRLSLRPLPLAHPSPNHSWHVKRLLGPPPGLAHLATCLYLSDSRGTFIHPFIHPSLSFSLWMHFLSTLVIHIEEKNHSLSFF